MRASRMYAAASMRRNVGGVLVLTVLVGFVGAVVLASLAGSRRTETSFDRFREETLAQDLTVFIPRISDADLAELRRLPGVEAMGIAKQLTTYVNGRFGSVGGQVDREIGRSVLRPRLLEGRRARQDRTREIVVPEATADAEGVGVGDHIRIRGFTPAQILQLAQNERVEPSGPDVRVRVVGISRAPADLSIEGAGGGLMLTTRAFLEEYGDRIGSFGEVVLAVRLTDEAAAARFIRAARDRAEPGPAVGEFQVQPSGETEGAVQQSIDVVSAGLLAFAVIGALTGLVVVAIALRRLVDRGAPDLPALRSLGLSQSERVLAIALPVVVIAVGGAVVALVGATLASPLMPMGLAREAEPDPGLAFDLVVVGGGAVAIALITLLTGAIAGWRAVRDERMRVGVTPKPPRALGRGVTAAFTPPVAVGAAMAIEPGRGAHAVPVRQGVGAVVVAIAGIVAVVMLGASLDRLTETPAAYGYNWDAHYGYCQDVDSPEAQLCAAARRALRTDRGVDAAARSYAVAVSVEGHPITGYAIVPVRGRIAPTVIDGRAPRTASEVALGAETLDAIGAEVDDRVAISGETGDATYRVVGIVALPVFTEVGGEGDLQAVADGAVFTRRGLGRISETAFGGSSYVVRWAPGTDEDATIARLAAASAVLEQRRGAVVPLEVLRLEQVDDLPWILGAFLAVIGLLGIAYVTLVGVRRRARDLAVLKTVGFRRSQIVTTVATQASLLCVAGLLVGIPLGLLLGRFIWDRIAHGAGLGTTVAAPAAVVALVALGSIVVVNLVALVPARRAARLQPATVLRSE